jgi:hypothetical protein
MKLRNVVALLRMIHGTKAQPPMSITNTAPRLMLKYCGQRDVMSEWWWGEQPRPTGDFWGLVTLTVAKWYGICTDVDADLSQAPERSTEESRSPASRRTLPLGDDIEWLPKNRAIYALRRTGTYYAHDADCELENWDEWQLPDLMARLLCETGEVWNIDRKGGETPCWHG